MSCLLILSVWAFADIPSFEELEDPESKLATQVIAEDGEILTTFHIENRSYVSYEELSPYLIEAAVATEDVRFYSHSGIDFRSLARVLVKTLMMSDSSQGGGSTNNPSSLPRLSTERRPRRQLSGSETNQDDLDKAQGMDNCRQTGKELHQERNPYHVHERSCSSGAMHTA